MNSQVTLDFIGKNIHDVSNLTIPNIENRRSGEIYLIDISGQYLGNHILQSMLV